MFSSRFFAALILLIIGTIWADAASIMIWVWPPQGYYVSNTGSDSNSGRSPGAPWQTITKVNAGVYAANDTISFKGGQTFTGGISIGTANYSSTSPPTSLHPVKFTSYGAGNATISSASVAGFSSLSVGALEVTNLTFTGGGISSTTVDGVHIETTQAGNAKLDHIRLTNLIVSQYGGNGVAIFGNGAATAGFNDVIITGVVAHDNTGGASPSAGSAGIYVYARGTSYGLGPTTPATTNVTISNSQTYNNTGKAVGPTNWTGSGIVVSECGTCLITTSIAYNNGTLPNHGSVGIWTYDARDVTISYNESYGNHLGTGTDGGGFDLDGGCLRCLAEYNYSHDNVGAGFMVFSYTDGSVTLNDQSTVRYNISVNDGLANSEGCLKLGGTATMTNLKVYNNTFYNANAQSVATLAIENGGASGYIANNIIYTTGGKGHIAPNPTSLNPSSLTIVGNDYVNPGGSAFKIIWNSVTYTSMATWQTATGQEKISGVSVAILTDPSLASGGSNPIIGGYVPASLPWYKLLTGSTGLGTGLDLNSRFSINPGSVDYYGGAIPNGGSGTGFNVGAYGGLGIASNTLPAVTFDPLTSNTGLSAGNLKATATAAPAAGQQARSTTARNTGKYYIEFTPNTKAGTIGVGLVSQLHTTATYQGNDLFGMAWLSTSTFVWNNATKGTWNTWPVNHVIAFAVDLDGQLAWGKDITAAGNWNNNGSANPATGTLGVTFNTLRQQSWMVGVNPFTTSDAITVNFGATAFTGTPPSGFVAWQQ